MAAPSFSRDPVAPVLAARSLQTSGRRVRSQLHDRRNTDMGRGRVVLYRILKQKLMRRDTFVTKPGCWVERNVTERYDVVVCYGTLHQGINGTAIYYENNISLHKNSAGCQM